MIIKYEEHKSDELLYKIMRRKKILSTGLTKYILGIIKNFDIYN